MPDIIIRGGMIIDGTGASRFRDNIALENDHIVQIGDLDGVTAPIEIDATGKVVAPGFVDVHTHDDGWLLREENFFIKTHQGFTTEVMMADGISYAPVSSRTERECVYYLRSLNGLDFEKLYHFDSIGSYLNALDGQTAQNVLTHIPYANVRVEAMGWGRGSPDDYQMVQIQRMIAEGMEQGAVGLSTGLDYISQCFASTQELIEACEAMQVDQGLYVSHIRYKKGVLAGVQEAVEIGIMADVPVHISHLKANTRAEADEVLQYINKFAIHEVSFSFDVYPYMSSSTMLNFMLPYEVWVDGPFRVIEKLHSERVRKQFTETLASLDLSNLTIAWLPSMSKQHWIGKTLQEYVDVVGTSPAEALADLLIEEGLAVLLVFRHPNDDLVNDFLKHQCYMMGTDGIWFPDSKVNPRISGSVGKLMGSCVRDKKLFSLEEAVYKLSGFPSERFGLAKRGIIKEGNFADIVIFDADSIVDHATYDNPLALTTGIEHVLVNGMPIIRDGIAVDNLSTLPGRALRFGQ